MVGGTKRAPQVMLVGWGEGLDQAAAWLNRQPDADSLRAISWYADGPFSYVVHGPAVITSYLSPESWTEADYAVLYANQWQRQLPTEQVIDYVSGGKLVQTIEQDGLELARVYDMRGVPEPAFVIDRDDRVVDFGSQVRVWGFEPIHHTALAGDVVPFSVEWERVRDSGDDAVVLLELVSERGEHLWQRAMSVRDLPAAGTGISEEYIVEIPEEAPTGLSYMTVQVVDSNRLAPLPLLHEHGNVIDGSGVYEMSEVLIQRLQPIAVSAAWPGVHLIAAARAESVEPGQDLLVEVQVGGQIDDRLKLSLRLVDEFGQMVAQNDKVLDARPRFALPLPSELPPGQYRLEAVLYDPETLLPLPNVHSEPATILDTVTIFVASRPEEQ